MESQSNYDYDKDKSGYKKVEKSQSLSKLEHLSKDIESSSSRHIKSGSSIFLKGSQ